MSRPRWETYADEIVGKDDPALAKEIEEYSKHRHEGPSSQQNQEELARWKEGNWQVAKEYRFIDPADYAEFEPRKGRILSYEQFITILRDKCKLKCFYREMGHDQKLALWGFVKGETEPIMGSWVQRPYMIEFEIPHFDDKGVVLDTKHRGWRTCLMDLRRKNLLTEETITRVFGRAYGPASGRYNSFMQDMRHSYGL
jgi:hypothetical protein